MLATQTKKADSRSAFNATCSCAARQTSVSVKMIVHWDPFGTGLAQVQTRLGIPLHSIKQRFHFDSFCLVKSLEPCFVMLCIPIPNLFHPIPVVMAAVAFSKPAAVQGTSEWEAWGAYWEDRTNKNVKTCKNDD